MTSSCNLKDSTEGFGLRFWVFSIAKYYPAGGFNDFDKGFDTLEEVYEYIAEEEREERYIYSNMIQIFDSKDKVLIYHYIDGGKIELTKEK
ncbi:hypothetical protein N9937_01880 [bacterium]|nr:hypothetical protein [bacterium]